MANTDILLGRGVVSLAGNDVGLCSACALRHEVESSPIATWDANDIGGAAEVARRSRVFIDVTLHELTANNRAVILDLIGDPDAITFSWAGKNTMAASCATSSWSLSATIVLLPAPRIALIGQSFEDASIQLTGECIRASGSTSWYTLTVT